MYWVHIDKTFGTNSRGETSSATMTCSLRQDGSIIYFIDRARYLPGDDADIYPVFEAKYGGTTEAFAQYIRDRIDAEFRGLQMMYEQRLAKMRIVKSDNTNMMLFYLDKYGEQEDGC